MSILLTREEFRVQVLARHAGRCCVPHCSAQAVDAHHILNRNLFIEAHERGGYFLDNGANVCSSHHLQAEQTLLSTKDLYQWCGIVAPVIPQHLSVDVEYDTWGNVLNTDGTRERGELFDDPGCQKVLKSAGLLWKFGYCY